MNTVLSKSKNGQIKLFIDQPGVAPPERLVVALAELHEGLGAWNVMDIRLSQYGVVSRYFNVGAESFWSCRVAESIQEAQWVRSKLRETFPVIEGENPLSVEWCTYNGIVRGKTPIELGVSTHMSTPAAVLHKRKDVDSILADQDARQTSSFMGRQG